MTSRDPDKLSEMLAAYAEFPMRSGDAAFLLDNKVCMEIEGLADHWDDVLRRNTAQVLRETATTVVVAVARPGAVLLPSDYQLWRDLHQELKGSDVDLQPLRAIPADDGDECTAAAS